MEDNSSKKIEKVYRIFFSKIYSTKKYPRKKRLYKDIYAYSRKEAIQKAKNFIESSKKELKIIQ